MSRSPICALLILILLGGCTTLRETKPSQTARQQLLLSTAADRASQQIAPGLPQGDHIHVDAGNFGAGSDYQSQYAINSIKSALLRQGYALAPDADKADTILLVSSGALSIDETQQLVGLPSAAVPIPLAGDLETPELALWKSEDRTGVAKFLLTYYDADSGELQHADKPVYGFSNFNRSSVLFYGYTSSDLLPPDAERRSPDSRHGDDLSVTPVN